METPLCRLGAFFFFIEFWNWDKFSGLQPRIRLSQWSLTSGPPNTFCNVCPRVPALLDAFSFLLVLPVACSGKILLSLFSSMNNLNVHAGSTHSSSQGRASPIYTSSWSWGCPSLQLSVPHPLPGKANAGEKAATVTCTHLRILISCCQWFL